MEQAPADSRCEAAVGDVPRYTDLPLPAYAFLPGTDPHPTADPRGHSYRRPPPEHPWRPPAGWADCTAYLYGCDLFNRGYFWEAHEAWESLWMGCRRDSTQARYLQGLIQAANSLLKYRMGRRRAVERLRMEVLRHLAVVPDNFMGLRVQCWARSLDASLRAPERRPYPALRLSSYL